MKTHFVVLAVLFKISLCRDFYVGMFKKNDFLVAQDTLYREKKSFGFTVAKYGRLFHCPITYFRVSDRLGVGRPPRVTVNRGGLRKKYLTLILTSSYNMPIAVNIYVGCENTYTTKMVTTTTTTAPLLETSTTTKEQTDEAEEEGKTTAAREDEGNAATEGGDTSAEAVTSTGAAETTIGTEETTTDEPTTIVE